MYTVGGVAIGIALSQVGRRRSLLILLKKKISVAGNLARKDTRGTDRITEVVMELQLRRKI